MGTPWTDVANRVYAQAGEKLDGLIGEMREHVNDQSVDLNEAEQVAVLAAALDEMMERDAELTATIAMVLAAAVYRLAQARPETGQ